MSAKGQVRPIVHDAYPTPPWCVHRLLEAIEHKLPRGDWLEPAIGTGAIVKAADQWMFKHGGETPCWTSCDINPTHEACLATPVVHSVDYTAAVPFSQWPFDVAITNPPFSLLFEFARKMLAEADHVLLLGRINVLGSGKRSGRYAWLQRNTPDVYVLPDRPVFAHKLKCRKGCKGVMIAYDQPTPETIRCGCLLMPVPAPVLMRRAAVDATEYAWFHWERGRTRPAQLHLLPSTPDRERVDRIIP